MMAFAAAIEPLRAANRLRREKLFDWRLFSRDGAPVRASNGIEIAVHAAIGRDARRSTCCSCAPERATRARATPRRPSGCAALARRGSRSAASVSAPTCRGRRPARRPPLRAALGKPRRVRRTVPASAHDVGHLRHRRRRRTCSGGTAALDLMLQFISERDGRALASECPSSSSIRASATRTIRSAWPCKAGSASPTRSSSPRSTSWKPRHDEPRPGARHRGRRRLVAATARAPVRPLPAARARAGIT